MFTGIIEGTARVKSITKLENVRRAARMKLMVDLGRLGSGIKVGDSVSINGTCLTVTRINEKHHADFEIVDETIQRTTLGTLRTNDKVNIERCLRWGDRLEGHLVLGHIDGTGRIEKVANLSNGKKIWIKLNNIKLMRYIASKGSVAVDGVSLTIVDVRRDQFSVSIIPHTTTITTLGKRCKGDEVNIEIDIVSRYVNILQPQ
jgi:riboflavin synthase